MRKVLRKTSWTPTTPLERKWAFHPWSGTTTWRCSPRPMVRLGLEIVKWFIREAGKAKTWPPGVGPWARRKLSRYGWKRGICTTIKPMLVREGTMHVCIIRRLFGEARPESAALRLAASLDGLLLIVITIPRAIISANVLFRIIYRCYITWNIFGEFFLLGGKNRWFEIVLIMLSILHSFMFIFVYVVLALHPCDACMLRTT